MSPFLHGFGDQVRLLGSRRRHRLMLLLFLGASALSAATYRRGTLRELPAAVYDQDGTALSRALVRSIDATPELRVITDPPPTLDGARAAFSRGELCAVVLVPDGFTADLKRGRRAEVLVAADLSNVLTGKTAQRAVARVLATAAAGAQVSLVEKLGVPPPQALARVMPITITEALPGNPGASYALYAAPAFAYFFAHVLTLFLAWSVLWPAVPGRSAAELMGRLCACLAAGVAAGLAVSYGILRLDGLTPASPAPVVLAAVFALAAADVLFAAALGALFRGGLLGFQATVLLAMLSLMLSGLTWPWDAIPAPLRAVASVIPFTPFGRALRFFFHARVGLADLAVPLGWMGLQAAACAAVIGVARLLSPRRPLSDSGSDSGSESESESESESGWKPALVAAAREELRLIFGGRPLPPAPSPRLESSLERGRSGGTGRRERSGILTVLLVVPLVYPAVVAYLYHREDARERPALLLDLDGSALSRRLALDLDATPEIRVAGRPASLEDGVAALRRGDAELLLVVPADLTRQVKRGGRAQLAVWSTGGNVYTWSTAFPAASAVVGAVDAELAARSFLAAGLPPEVARRRAAPIATGDRRLFHPSGSYGRYVATGVLLVVIQQLVLVSLAFSAGVRRERGMQVGAPPHPLAHLSGMAAAHAPFWLGGALFVSCVLLPWMGWSGPSAAATAALFALFVAALAPASAAVASLVPDRVSAFQILMFFSVPLFVASGFTWPPAELPRAVEAVTLIFPATPALRALRVLSMRTGDLRAVLPEVLWLLGQAAAFTGLAAWLGRSRRGGRTKVAAPRPPARFAPTLETRP